jgi:anti-anti-sigma factor
MESDAAPGSAGAPAVAAKLTRPQSDTTVCSVIGTVDSDTAPILRDALADARCDDNAHLVIDMSAVTSMDSAGLYTLFVACHKHSIAGGGHLAAVIPLDSPAIPDLYVVSLNTTFDLHSDLVGALEACASAGESVS